MALAAIVLALALPLRCLFLGKESLWFDELQTWWISIDLGRALEAEPTNPPIYHLLMYGWIKLAGTTEAALRSLSVVAGIASLFTTWWIGRRLTDRRVALGAVLYQSISTFHIFYSQEARTHALLLLLLSGCFVLLLKAAGEERARVRWAWLAAYAVLAALSLYTHFVATFYIVMHGMYVLAAFRRRPRMVVEFAAAGAGALLLFWPWLRLMLATAASGGQVRRFLLLKVPQTYFSFLFGDTLVPLDEMAVRQVRETLADSAGILTATTLVSLAVLVFAIRGLRRLPLPAAAAIVAMGAGPVALSLAVSLAGVRMFDERYVLSSTPFVYLAVALGLVEMWAAARRRAGALRIAVGAVTAVYAGLLLLSLAQYYTSPRFGKEQWRDALVYLEANVPAAGLIVFEPDFIEVAQRYYGRRPIDGLRVSEEVRQQILSGTGMDAVLGGHRSIWLVRCHEPDDKVLEAFAQRFREEKHVIFPKAKGIDIHGFRRN